MKTVLAVLLALCALSAAAVESAQAIVPVISDVWISEAPPVAKNNAAFLVLKNGKRKDALLGVTTVAAEVAEMHEMSMAGGLMRMQRLPLVNLAPHAEVRFAPGGRHIMLINMKQPLKAGDKVPLTLRFRKAGKITVQAEVRPLEADAGDAAAHDGHHHH